VLVPQTGNFVACVSPEAAPATFFPLAGKKVERADAQAAHSTLFPPWGLRRRVGVWLRNLVAFMRRGRAATPARPAR
jgi:hypothetical protein